MARALTNLGGGPRGRLPLQPMVATFRNRTSLYSNKPVSGEGGGPWALGLCTSRMDRETLPNWCDTVGPSLRLRDEHAHKTLFSDVVPDIDS